MKDFFKVLEQKKVDLPANVNNVLSECRQFDFFNTSEELAIASTNGEENTEYHVKYDIPGIGEVTETIVHRVANGISANYVEPYMRRRDPDTMTIADDLPTDKKRFRDVYGYEFEKIQSETYDWLKEQELAVFLYFAGRANIGSLGIAIAPANAAFFALALSMLQEIVSLDKLQPGAKIKSVIFVAPTFRHTHFEGKQAVVHKRTKQVHEVYAYNLYPGPSAKKGLYSVLLDQGEKEGWITAHCSSVQSISPYDNITTFMHEGASGGGKSELHQHIVREPEGRVKLGTNTLTGEERFITIPRFCSFRPVADDMAFCHPSIQKKDGKLRIVDAENSWFVRVDSITEYGDDPFLEKMILNPKKPLVFLNIDTTPNSTAIPWNHIEDEPGMKCPNPRVILPRNSITDVVDEPVAVDIRSFGIRTPVCSKDEPTYGIVGLYHILPPALAWLWRLVAPRGHKNPSIISTGKMDSEGVGSYWPFATGIRINHANLLLKQIIDNPRTTYTLVPNQNIGVWKVGFRPQLLMREYLTRRGVAKLKDDQFQPARCSVLGYELNYLTLEGSKIPSRFLKVYNQPEVGFEGYDAGAEILENFFRSELPKFLGKDLFSTGRRIIEACLDGATIKDYCDIIPMGYSYSFHNMDDYENGSH